MMKGIQIVKRDGSKEPFYPWKVQRVVMAAGLDAEQSNKCTSLVTDWVMNQENEEVSSLSLRDKVLDILKEMDPYAANMFDWYQSQKEENNV